VYAAIGTDLHRVGINVDLAPCADVFAVDGSPVIGTRSFGPSPDLVARHVAAAVSGLQGAGVAACTKHFPGHGSTAADSHRMLATISGSLEEIRARDLPPFAAAIAAGTWSIMPGHLRVPELTGDLPATLSPAAIAGLLRGELGYDGVVICDALEMKAASAVYGIPEAAVLTIIAGTDLMCLGRDTDEAMYHAVRATIADAVTSGRLPAARLEEAAARVAALRARLGQGRRDFVAPANATHDGIGMAAARRALRRSGPLPARLENPLVVEVEPEENIAAGRFTWGFSPWTVVRRLDPAAGDGAAANALASEAADRRLVLAVRNALGVLPLVSGVLAARPDTVIVEMGVPAWTPPEGTAYLATYGASRACAQAAAEALGLALSRRTAATAQAASREGDPVCAVGTALAAAMREAGRSRAAAIALRRAGGCSAPARLRPKRGRRRR
jgi:beta-N-acetylhexosaminidase